jgi:hypothetical protein
MTQSSCCAFTRSWCHYRLACSPAACSLSLGQNHTSFHWAPQCCQHHRSVSLNCGVHIASALNVIMHLIHLLQQCVLEQHNRDHSTWLSVHQHRIDQGMCYRNGGAPVLQQWAHPVEGVFAPSNKGVAETSTRSITGATDNMPTPMQPCLGRQPSITHTCSSGSNTVPHLYKSAEASSYGQNSSTKFHEYEQMFSSSKQQAAGSL